MKNADPVVIVSMARTPLGNMLGCLKDARSPELGATAIKAALARSKIKSEQIDEVIMGCVLPAGLGQAPARQAALAAGLTNKTAATTVNKMCGSGMKALMMAYDGLLAGSGEVFLAGGMESMSNAPYLIPQARAGYRLGHGQIQDHMMLDGLEDAYDKGLSMGVFAELAAETFHFSRRDQDEFALCSLKRAQHAQKNGLLVDEIAPVQITTRKGLVTVQLDENPQVAKLEKIPQLKPAFKPGGSVTAANSSSISDGAAALLLMRKSKAQQLGIKPLATIIGHSTHAQEPKWFTTAPVGAIEKLLKKINWSQEEVDLFEINEAFAVVTLYAIKQLKLATDKVNVFGGACAIGHPIGASGARIVVTLINALQQKSLKKGIASLCIGGGEATALALELV